MANEEPPKYTSEFLLFLAILILASFTAWKDGHLSRRIDALEATVTDFQKRAAEAY